MKNKSKFSIFRFITFLGNRGFLKFIPDKIYLKLFYRAYHSKKLNLDYPKTFNEKIQWLKLYDRNENYTVLTDKVQAKEYFYMKTGIKGFENLGIYEKFDEIDFQQLPDKFVIKCSHDSGSTIICDKNNMNIGKIKKTIEKKLKKNYYWPTREYNYKNIKPRIIIEEFKCDESKTGLIDYKFYTFNGTVKLIQVDLDRFGQHKRQFYDRNWTFLNLTCDYPNSPETVVVRPACYDEMITSSEIVASGIKHLRVDFYVVDDRPFFGEMTFHHSGGDGIFTPQEYDGILGDWLNLDL